MKKLLLMALMLVTLQVNAQTENAQYPGGRDALYAFIDQNLTTPKEAIEQQVYGTIFVRVEVNKKGKPTKVGVTKPSGYDYLDNEAVRVVKLINEWTPAMKNGKPIDGEVIVAVEFEQKYDPTNVVSASFPGGDEAMQAFFDQNVIYPEDAKAKRIFGTIYVETTIDAQGIARDIKVTSPSAYPSLDAEAVRLVSLVKQWQPATNNGVPFENLYVVPVTFNIKPEANNDNNQPQGQNATGGNQNVQNVQNGQTGNNTQGGKTNSGKSTNSAGQQTNNGGGQQQLKSMPSFPGGAVPMLTFISKNKKYPEEELKKKIEGDVTVVVTIDKEGNVVNPRIQKSVTPNLDAEAIRIVKLMPKWEPAEDTQGNPMECDMPITVNFRTPKPLDGVPFH